MGRIARRLPVLIFVIVMALAIYFGAVIIHPDWVYAGETNEEEKLSNGTYLPSGFTFSGGSGKVDITCTRFRVEGGKANAEIVFSSPNYEYVKVGEETYDPVKTEDTSMFTIPVELNEPMSIIGMTTAMSEPHEITYEICVYYGETPPEEETTSEAEEASDEEVQLADANKKMEEGPPEIAGLTFLSAMDLDYADQFAVYYYSDDYKVLRIPADADYLLVPEGKEVPEDLEEDMTVLHSPVDHIYLAASAVMSLFDALDGLDHIAFSGTNASGWYVEDARKAMEDGEIRYAGKYSEPDYELLVSGNCDLAVESTMILHSPKVQEMIEDLGIPVLVDYSSYEEHPLGRTEWIKFYGALIDKEDEAKTFFDGQKKVMEEVEDFPATGETVAVFYITSDGLAVVRGSDDYIPAMIKIAGGKYVFDDLKNTDSNSPSIRLTMEEFYAQAADADDLIYNGTVDDTVTTVEDLIAKNELFADFKAVKDGNVWYTGKNLYQATDAMGDMIRDLHTMLTDEDAKEMAFLTKLEQ